MRKFFFLIPALVLALAVNAAVINITPTSPYDEHDNLRLALYYANAGDEIVLADGIYLEQDDYLYFNKDITVRAAEGAKPVIKMTAYAQIKDGANIKIKGLKFDGSVQGSYDYYFRFYDNSHTSLRLDDCEFYDIKQIVITATADVHTDSCIINNCFFHNNKQQAMYFYASNTEGRQTCDSLAITNSTFANTDALTNWISVIDIRPYGTAITDAIKVRVDHCTFYNNPTVDSGHANIRPYKLSDVVISNCVFAMPTTYDLSATYCSAGSVTNCIAYNYVHDNNKGHAWGPTVTKSYVVSPLFKDPDNNDFTLRNASPAKGRDTNGNAIGDPRWVKDHIDTIAAPAILLPADALLTDSAGVIAGTPDTLDFKLKAFGGSHKYNSAEYAKWTINVTKAGEYAFKINAYNPTAGISHKYTIRVYDPADEANPVLEETTSSASAAGDYSPTTNKVTLAKKTYIVKVWNPTSWSVGNLVNVEANYEGGEIIAVPDTLWPVDALRSARAFVNGDGELRFTDDDHAGYVREQYGKWNINVTDAGKYKFTANVNSTNGQNYRITLKSADESSTIGTWYGEDDDSGERQISTELVNLASSNYVLMIEDTVKYSHGRVANIVASYEGGKTVNVPGQILAKEAVIGKVENGHQKMYHLMENGDLHYNDNGSPREEFATWTIHADDACNLSVSFDMNAASTSGHEFLIELHNNLGKIDSVEETKLTKFLAIPAAGDYTLKLINRKQWSSAILHSITIAPYVAPAGVTMTDTDTDNTAWVANVGGAAVDVQMTRTILGGMYNTICLPFSLNSTKCKALFGNDVELYTLGSATLCGDILNLQFDVASDIHKGTPVLIKTSTNIVDPLFEGVTIESATADHTKRGIVDFRGTFVSMDFNSGDQVLLLLSNNNLAYPQSNKTLKGFRAYFQISGGAASAPVVRGARIIAGEQVVTAIDLVETQNETVQKVIENGQLIIIKDGVRYNVMGIQIQ